MRHFKIATIKLTLMYVALLMGLSLIFSVWLYNAAARELHIVGSAEPSSGIVTVEDTLIQAGSQRLLNDLIYFNLVVFGGGTLLSYLLARRTLRPIQQNYQLQEEFAANASHQLRTPLTILRGELQLLLRDNEKVPAKYQTAVQSSLEEVDRLISLSTRLLRMSAGSASPVEKSRVKSTLDKTIKRLQPLIDEKDLIIKRRALDVTVPMAEADFVEVLSIILDNAIKYSPTGGTIWLNAKTEERQVRISIVDSGPGITPDDLPRIFERFYRAKHAPGDGYGLGLALARQLTDEAGGSIGVDSRPGHTSFIISFPI